MYYILIVYGYRFGYDDRLYDIHDDDMDWTMILDLIWTRETLFAQG